MYELGKKTEIFGAELLEPVNTGGSTKLDFWPPLKKDFSLVCGFDQGLGERMIVCENMEDVKKLNEAYHNGYALNLHWYQGPDPGFISIK